MRLSYTHASAILWATLLGCIVDVSTDDSSSSSMGTGETAGDGDGDGDGDTGEPWEPIPARGNIELTQVVVNQGVDVPIANLGVWVGPTERNTFVVSGRDTLLRGYWEIPDDWVGRDITAVLDLSYPDGTTATQMDTKTVDGPSFAGDLSRGFIFQLVADDFPPGVEYHIGLWEAAPGAEDLPESTTVIESPLDGLQLIGAQPEPAELKVVIMPVIYDDGMGCSTNSAESVTADNEQLFHDYMHEQYPVQSVTIDIRRDTPIVWNEPLTSLAELWGPLQDQRAAENAAPNVYFFALVDACTGGIDMAGGIAAGIVGDTKGEAYLRVATGLWQPNTPDYWYETLVHEVGHLHGRAHVQCNNPSQQSQGNDPTYPYDGGIIGVWGFGIKLFQLHSPTATFDFMSYCQPVWISDWGWSKAFNRIRTLTAWDYAAPSEPEPPGEVMIGLLFENGKEKWWRTPGSNTPEHFSSSEFIEFDYGDEVLRSPTAVRLLDDGTTMVEAMVPRPNVEFQAASRISAAGQVRALALDLQKRP